MEELQCPVCLDSIQDARILPCGHSYCLSCLNSVGANHDYICCPTCRKRTLKTTAQSFPRNHMLNQLQSQLKNVPNPCEVHYGQSKCMVCMDPNCGEALLCAMCVEEGHSEHELVHFKKRMRERKAEAESAVSTLTTIAKRTKTDVERRARELKYMLSLQTSCQSKVAYAMTSASDSLSSFQQSLQDHLRRLIPEGEWPHSAMNVLMNQCDRLGAYADTGTRDIDFATASSSQAFMDAVTRSKEQLVRYQPPQLQSTVTELRRKLTTCEGSVATLTQRIRDAVASCCSSLGLEAEYKRERRMIQFVTLKDLLEFNHYTCTQALFDESSLKTLQISRHCTGLHLLWRLAHVLKVEAASIVLCPISRQPMMHYHPHTSASTTCGGGGSTFVIEKPWKIQDLREPLDDTHRTFLVVIVQLRDVVAARIKALQSSLDLLETLWLKSLRAHAFQLETEGSAAISYMPDTTAVSSSQLLDADVDCDEYERMNGVGAYDDASLLETLPRGARAEWQHLSIKLEQLLLHHGTYYSLKTKGGKASYLIILKKYSPQAAVHPVTSLGTLWVCAADTVNDMLVRCARRANMDPNEARLVLIENPSKCMDFCDKLDSPVGLHVLPFASVVCIQKKDEPLTAFPEKCEKWIMSPFTLAVEKVVEQVEPEEAAAELGLQPQKDP